MPHLTVRLPESQLLGHERELIASLTEAVVAIYGEWVRASVVVVLDAVADGRWGVGGHVADDAAPWVLFGIRESALARANGREIAERIVLAVTDALVDVLGERVRDGTNVELVAHPDGRWGTGGALVD